MKRNTQKGGEAMVRTRFWFLSAVALIGILAVPILQAESRGSHPTQKLADRGL